jgi:hypothetical protein
VTLFETSTREPAASGRSSVSSMRWDGGELSVGMALQSPALMNRSMMSPAQQGQVGQVGGATVQPVP